MSARLTIKVLLALFISLSYLGCKKTDPIIIEIQTPESSFKTFVMDSRYMGKQLSKINTVDSSFYFEIPNQSGDPVTYQWDFGDGTKSELQNPKHAYAATGTYTVKLTTSRQNQAFDTSEIELSVITGQKDISLGKTITTAAISILETKDNDFLLLGYSYDIKKVPNTYSYFLMKLDKNLKTKSIFTFPENTRVNSISACSDGHYIFTGTTSGNPNHTELIKMSAEGTVIWSKTIDCDHLTEARQTADNGFILTGSRDITDGYNKYPKSLIVKTDVSGNRQWEKFFDKDLMFYGTDNTIIEDDGYVFGAVKKSSPVPYCSNCDSISVIKLDPKGALIWKSTVAWGLNEETPAKVNISKMKNGNYNVIGSYKRGLYIFSPSGGFVDRKLLDYQAISNSSDINGGIAVLQHEWGNGFRARLTGYSETGSAAWNIGINGCEKTENGGYRCSMDSWPVTVKPLKAGGFIFLSNKVHFDDYHYSIALIKVDKNGQIN